MLGQNDDNERKTRRGFLSRVGSKSLAVTMAILGLSETAKGDPFCCFLVYPGGSDCGSNADLVCFEYYGVLLCWMCTTGGNMYTCCECMVYGSQSCEGADETNTYWSCLG
jgi:hypothetical protein